MPAFSDFFADLDRAWSAEATVRPLPPRLIGSAALMLQTSYQRGTNDGDVLETFELTSVIQERLIALGGAGTTLHTRHRVYLQIVPSAIPFLPQRPTWHRVELVGPSLQHLELHLLDIVDVVVSKLKRMNAHDVSDIEAMAERGKVPHALLIERFQGAADMFAYDAWT